MQALALLLALAASAQETPAVETSTPAETTSPSIPAEASTPTAQTLIPALSNLGEPASMDKGPWALGEVLFFSSGKLTASSALRERVRSRRGVLLSRSEIAADLQSLKEAPWVIAAEAALFAIPDSPVPAEYAAIAASTSQVRLVFGVAERAAPEMPVEVSVSPEEKKIPPSPVSGVVLTPTAYRGTGRYNSPGMGLDINAAYFIGRLYGRNTFDNSVRKRNYIDRIGVWFLNADGKMQVQSETQWLPALAAGAQGGVVFRDAPQPNVTTVNLSVKITEKTTRFLSSGYIVGSKNFWGLRSSVGFMQGDMGDAVAQISEFLTPQSLEFYAGRRGDRVRSRSVPFASLLYMWRPHQPLGVEIMKFNGAALNPILVNFKLGQFLKLNFDLAYLKFNGGYEILGTFQFRYNHFPRR